MLCTLGGAGLWYLYDLIVVAGGSFQDSDGRPVSVWDPTQAGSYPAGLSQEVLEELLALRSEVADLAERMDFTERLLVRPRSEEDRASPSLKPEGW